MIFALWLALLAVAALPPTRDVQAAADCSAYLMREDATAHGASCPELPALAQVGVIRPAPPAHAKRGRVREIVDGDTIGVSFGDTLDTVRIIGIDTPETHSPRVGPQCYGQEAAAYVAGLLPIGAIVWLERDVSDRDQYDRLLRHVWFAQADGSYRLLGDAIVREGFAEAKRYPPDLGYADWLAQAQNDAIGAGRGLWRACGGANVPLSDPQPTATAAGSIGIAARTACDPAYPDICLAPPSVAGDLDCADIPYRRFKVLPPDPHHFDADGNGIGCEGD